MLRSFLGLALLLLLLPGTAGAQSDKKAVDLVSRAYEKAVKVLSFQAEFQIIREDPRFLNSFWPAGPSAGGLLNFDSSRGQYNLYLRVQGTDYQHFTARGMAVSWAGPQRINDGSAPVASPPAAPPPVAAPAEEPSFPDLTSRTARPLENHPLAFMWPYVLRGPSPRSRYRLEAEGDVAGGVPCARIQVSGGSTAWRLWVDPAREQIVQVETGDGEARTRATCTAFHPADPRTGFAMYRQLAVSVGSRPVYVAELIRPQINPNRILLSNSGGTVEALGTGARRKRNEQVGRVGPFLTGGLVLLVTLLGLALGFLGYRYLRFAVSRQPFSEELILVERPVPSAPSAHAPTPREGGGFGDRLRGLGYAVEPFDPEVLTHERGLLGKGATVDTTMRPRAVVVAPDSFGEIKGYFFLLKAYVEEGGRVLAMSHSTGPLPFEATLVPAGDPLVCRHGAFRTMTDRDAERLAVVLAPDELYQGLPGGLLATRSGAVAVGVLRQGKGEFMLCQLRLDRDGALGRQFLDEMILTLQGRDRQA